MPDPRRNTRALAKLGKYLHRPRTIQQIQERYEISERCAYRWLSYLQQEGQDIVSRRVQGEVRFSVAAS